MLFSLDMVTRQVARRQGGVEAPITDHGRSYVQDLGKCKVVQIFPHVGRTIGFWRVLDSFGSFDLVVEFYDGFFEVGSWPELISNVWRLP